MTTKVLRSIDDAQADFAVVAASEVGADPAGSAAAAQAAAIAASQPVDSDLTAIAALTTTAYGRSFLELANAGAGRTLLALGTAATAATGDFDAAGAAAAAQAASQPVDSDLTAIAALTTTAYGRSLLEAANAAGLRTLAGLGTAATSNTGDFDPAGAATTAVGTHAGAGDPHTGYRLESADHSHETTGLQGGTVAHTALTSVGVNDHHNRDHAATHGPAAADPLKLDDLAVPDDNTDLNASTSAHGLLTKLSNVAGEYLDGTGAFSTPAGGSGLSHPQVLARTLGA